MFLYVIMLEHDYRVHEKIDLKKEKRGKLWHYQMWHISQWK
jgi:hypothetical protein